MYQPSVSLPTMGCHLTPAGARFSLFTTHTHQVLLEVYEDMKAVLPIVKILLDETHQKESVFSVEVEGIKAHMVYVWRMVNLDYSYSPSILDPYGKGAVFYQGEWRNIIRAATCYSRSKPMIPWEQTIIYEMHVGHFTKGDLDLKEKRGTFKGIITKLPYLKALGVTSLELLPIFKWYGHTLKNRNPQTNELLEDIWGYNTISFFAIDERYSVSKDPIKVLDEFKELVEFAHKEGMEIILDVVYNHTGEGGTDGTAFHFKHLAPEIYYKYNDKGEFLNCSGTGNTLNTNHEVVKALIKDSLIYWTEELGVDGFRFDLASILGQDEKGRWLKESLLNEIAQHPTLSQIKLISESWDAKGSYDVGRMPYPFREWSDYFRDTIRQFVKGDQGKVKALADCVQGKEIYFTDSRKNKWHIIHLVTAHDGFTMWDLLSYNEKHNLCNGEDNRDGHNANYSYNWGIEGETDDLNILEDRRRGMRNLMCLLILSPGVPMLLMGDEVARTQLGNNNAFCQDDRQVWLDWKRVEKFKEQYEFTKHLIKWRKNLNYLKPIKAQSYEVSWHGIHQGQPDWSYYSRSIACYVKGEESFFFIANSYHESLYFEMPRIEGKWVRVIDTAPGTVQEAIHPIIVDTMTYLSSPYSISIFKAEMR